MRSGSANTHERNFSLICFCFSRAASVASWLTTRSSLVADLDGVVDDRRLHVERLLEQPGAVGPRRAVLGGRGDRPLGGVSRPRRSTPRLSSGGRPGWLRARRGTARRRTPGCRTPESTAPRDWRRCRRAARPRAARPAAPRRCGLSRAGLLGDGQLGPHVAREVGVGGLPGLRFGVVVDQVAQFGDDFSSRLAVERRR